MTNREWLASLSDEQLARFFTNGVLVNYHGNMSAFFPPFYLSILQVAYGYISSTEGIKKWLKEKQAYEVVSEQ